MSQQASKKFDRFSTVAFQLQYEGQAKNQNQMNAHAYLQFVLQAAQAVNAIASVGSPLNCK